MKTLFLCLFLTISTFLNAQTFIGTHQAIRYYNPYTERFGDFGDWYENTDTIIFKIRQEKVIIRSKYPIQNFTILRAPIKESKGDKDIMILDCVSFEGERCILELVHYKEKGEQLYIRWDKIQLVYQMKKL